MTKTAETASVAETETVPTMPGLPLSGATETVAGDVKHALDAVSDALDKDSYGDSVEGDLLEAHATLETLLERLS